MAATDLAVRIATIFDSAGVKKADKGFKGLEKSANKLGKTLGIALSTAAVVAFGKASVKAFMEDQKSAALLSVAVNNLGLAFEQANVEKFISDLERTSAIADDNLRPAFQALLTTTGSVAKSQELLKTAIDASRGSSIDLATVAQDLSNAYVGNTKGLKKYNLGLSQAELKSMSFIKVQKKLEDQFKGASAAYLETYTGKMEALTTASGRAQEVIGESLVNAIIGLTGAANTNELIIYIDNVAERIANLITSVEKFGFLTKYWFSPSNWFKKGDAGIKEWEDMLRKRAYAAGRAFDPLNNAVTGYKIDNAARLKAEADAKKRALELAKATAKNTAELKKQNALKLASKIFDLQQIQLVAALKGKLSDEDRTRVEAMSAILNDNEVLAAKLTEQILRAQDSTGNLYKYFLSIGDTKIKNPFEFLDTWLADFQKKLNATLTATSSATYTPAGLAPELAAIGVVAGYGAGVPMSVANQADNTVFPSYGLQTGGGGDTVINVTVQGNLIREQQLIDQVLAGTQLSSLSGSPSQIGRIAGMFG